MTTILIALSIIASLLLVLVILAQNPKGGGAGSQFGGSGTPIMGVKKTGDILEKMTWGFVVAIMIFAISANILFKPEDTGEETQYSTEGQGHNFTPQPIQQDNGADQGGTAPDQEEENTP